MTEDYFNGFNIVPLDADYSIKSILRSTAVADEHPWRDLYLTMNRRPPLEHSTLKQFSKRCPNEYKFDYELRGPKHNSSSGFGGSSDENEEGWQHTVRLCDVQAFRNSTCMKLAQDDVNNNAVAGLNGSTARLSTSPSIRPVIYRYVDVIKNSLALLEAIHFELFMPARPDLRFLAVQFTSVPFGTVEGDYFRLSDANLLPVPSFAIKLGKEKYPVMWEVKQLHKISNSSDNERSGFAYILKEALCGGMIAVSDFAIGDLFIRDNLFRDPNSRRVHSLVRTKLKDMSTANIFPVEPPVPPPEIWEGEQIDILNSLSSTKLYDVYKAYSKDVSKPKVDFKPLMWLKEHLGLRLAMVLFEMEHTEVDPRSEYLKLVDGIRTSSQRTRLVVTEVCPLSATEEEWKEDRLDDFNNYGQTEDDLEQMDKYFRIGSRYRNRAADGLETDDVDVEATKVDESLVFLTLMDTNISSLDDCRPILDCIYGRRVTDTDSDTAMATEPVTVTFNDGNSIRLNSAQSRAVRMYADKDGPRVFCVRSPPGSGKTLTAVAMAAEVARSSDCDGIQLLLSVQNVAVDHMGSLLKKVDFGGVEVYNMKTRNLNPHGICAYDLFDLMSSEELETWKKDKEKAKGKKKFETWIKSLKEERYRFEKEVDPMIFLGTGEMVTHKMLNNVLKKRLMNVKRIIIDEASLLTEAALYALIRRFPEARIVLIGDEKQLSPFQYDPNILGQEMAGRSALSVALKNGNVPIVELNEVYRAPPSLITPYNRLAYGGRLVSKKEEGEAPLCDIKLMLPGLPQLLLIGIDGEEKRNERTMSLYNEIELKALVRLLFNFDNKVRSEDIMIICLYKEQKLRVDKIINDRRLKCKVLTVDSAQGKEAPIVILLTTRTKNAPEFFNNMNRCNVAVSRHQKALIVIGNADFLISNEPWTTVLCGEVNQRNCTHLETVDFTRIVYVGCKNRNHPPSCCCDLNKRWP